jgi:hypothetical protein
MRKEQNQEQEEATCYRCKAKFFAIHLISLLLVAI